MAQFQTSAQVSYFEGWRAEIFMEFCTLFLGSPCHLGIIQPGELVPLLPGDHEGGQVGGVDGEEHHGEQRPHWGHEPEKQQRGSQKHFLLLLKGTKLLNLIM